MSPSRIATPGQTAQASELAFVDYRGSGGVRCWHATASNRAGTAVLMETDDEWQTEKRYLPSVSRPRADAAVLPWNWRGLWGIENRLHWVRDVTWGEDQCQVGTGHGPQNLAAFRNAAISLLRASGISQIASTLRRFAHQPRQLPRCLGIMKNRLALGPAAAGSIADGKRE